MNLLVRFSSKSSLTQVLIDFGEIMSLLHMVKCGNGIGESWVQRSMPKCELLQRMIMCPWNSVIIMIFSLLSSLTRYSTVVEQTTAIYREMVESEGWKDQAEVVVKNFRRLSVRVGYQSSLLNVSVLSKILL